MLGAPVTPAIDAEHTTDPPRPAETIAAAAMVSTLSAPTTLTSTTCLAWSRGYRSTRSNGPWTPALLNSPVGDPSALVHRATASVTSPGTVTSNVVVNRAAA